MPLNNPKPATPEAQALLKAAQRDWKTVEVLARDPDSPGPSVCFHAQQYVEKAIKAVLVSNGIVFRRTHDLGELTELLVQQGIVLPMPKDKLIRLNPFAATLRYQDVEFPSIETDEVLEIIEMTCVWLKEQLCA